MDTQMISHKQKQRRRLLFALPVLVIPFLSFFLWSLGVFKPAEATAKDTKTKAGLNMELPEATQPSGQSFDKFSAYQQANRDSVKLEEQLRTDPYAKHLETLPHYDTGIASAYSPSSLSLKTYKDPNETKVYSKIADLQKVLNTPPPANKPVTKSYANDSSANSAIKQLQNMLANKPSSNAENDPEMQQLSGLMDKIMDIQNPQRVKERLALEKLRQSEARLLVKDKALAVEAVIPETQTLVSGAVVRLRLLQDLVIDSNIIPKNSFVYGIGSLDNERLVIKIQTVRNDKRILPVNLFVYDLDGLEGIYVPGTITRDVAKQSAEQAVQDMNILSMDPSIKAQALATGINTAKNLFSKKAKLVRFTIKAGYQVLLREPIL